MAIVIDTEMLKIIQGAFPYVDTEQLKKDDPTRVLPLFRMARRKKKEERDYRVIREAKKLGFAPGKKVRTKDGGIYTVKDIISTGCIRLVGVSGSFGHKSLEIIG